jgi:hypothetical protein
MRRQRILKQFILIIAVFVLENIIVLKGNAQSNACTTTVTQSTKYICESS